MANVIKREITVAKHNFRLEIYPQMEGIDEICFEIFPHGYEASLYAFSNKKRLNQIVKDKHIYEPKK